MGSRAFTGTFHVHLPVPGQHLCENGSSVVWGGGELLLSSSSLYVVSRLPEPLGRDSSLRDAQKSRLESRGLPCEVLGATLTPAKS